MTPQIIRRAIGQHDQCSRQDGDSRNPCEIKLRLSFFFDGFGHDEGRKSISVPTVSNLAKLYFAHRQTRPNLGVYAFYFEGLGASFPARPTVQAATGGQLLRQGVGAEAAGTTKDVASETASRRVWDGEKAPAALRGALKESFNKRSLFTAGASVLAGVTLESWSVTRDSEILAGATGSGVEIRLNQALDRLKQAMAEQTQSISGVDIAIFGYDRGAAIARGFANKVVELYLNRETDKLEYRTPRQKKPAELRLTFLGLFDSVSSVAERNPVLGQLPFFKASLGERVKLRIPRQVMKIVHMAATHDPRFFMRADRIEGSGDRFEHYLYPGCQENVGGGLPPGCLGKTNDFAKLPARRMLAAAYRAGVQVYSLDELRSADRDVWESFQFSGPDSAGRGGASVDALYAAYRKEVGKLSKVKGKTSEAEDRMSRVPVSADVLQAHTVLWIKYLATRFGDGNAPADPALAWPVKWLMNEVRRLQYRREHGFALAPESRYQPLSAVEKQLLQAWESVRMGREFLPAEVVELFDRFLHNGVALTKLQRAFSEFWQDLDDDYALYFRPRAIEVLDGPGWADRLEEIRERNGRDPKIQQRNAAAQARMQQREEAGRRARQSDRERAGIVGYRES